MTADLVTFIEEILNGKLHLFVQWIQSQQQLQNLTHNQKINSIKQFAATEGRHATTMSGKCNFVP